MFRIGEFSKLVRVSPRMLRHYEKCGLLYPAEIDPYTGYRLYSAAQIPLLVKITTFRDMGFSIEEIGEILPNMENKAYLDKTLAQKLKEMQLAIEERQGKIALLQTMQLELYKEKSTMEYTIALKELPAVQVLTLRDILPNYSEEGELWHKMGRYLAKNGIQPAEGEESGYSIYHDEDHKDTDVDVEIAVPVTQSGANEGSFTYRELAAVPLAATLRFAGPYDGYAEATRQLAAWIEDNGYQMCGGIRGVALRTPADQTDPQNYLTELQAPVVKAKPN